MKATLLSLLLVAALAAPATAAASDVLITGQTLSAGQALASDDGHYVLTMQSDGNLVLYRVNAPASLSALWSSHTSRDVGDHAALQADGNLGVFDASGQTIWSSNSYSPGCTNLDLQDDG